MDAKPAGFSPSSSLQPTTILLVEDEKGVRDLIGSMLLQHGYTVLCCLHGLLIALPSFYYSACA